jgi:hypothetical protein
VSFYEDNVADGSHCMSCCGFIGEDVGYPRCCQACGGHGSTKHNKAVRKAEALEQFDKWLSNTRVQHRKLNNGLHVVLTLGDGRKVDCWPTTKKWQLRGQKISRSGKALHDVVRQSLRPWP